MINKRMRNINVSIKQVQLFNVILSIVGIAYLCYSFNYVYALTSLFIFLLFGIVGVNSGYHRYFSHRSYQTYRPVVILMAVIGTLASLGSLLSWVAVHRFHHLHADKEEDPHSPKQIGWWNAYTYNWKRTTISRKFMKDLIGDSVIMFLHRHYYKVILSYVILLMLIDPWLAIYAYAIPAVGCLNGVSAVTVISHIHGYKNHTYNDDAKNSWIATLFSLGEGWHNNHHVAPAKWQQGEKWWELDPPSWFIRLVKK